MRYSDNALNILTILSFSKFGSAWVVKNYRRSLCEIVALMQTKNAEIDMRTFNARKSEIEKVITSLKNDADGVVAIGDSHFPRHRGVVKDSEIPVALFYKGDLALLSNKNQNVSVIGTLEVPCDIDATKIELTERIIVRKLVEKGATIISGLAKGCDTIAHLETLDQGGKTIAILPSTLRNIQPVAHKDIAKRIVEQGGLLVTEYYTEPKSKFELLGRYPKRDRLQALYSNCVVLTASHSEKDKGHDCGSRLAMQYANNYNIKRAVVHPTNSDNPIFNLNREIADSDARVIKINKLTIDSAIVNILDIQNKLFQ